MKIIAGPCSIDNDNKHEILDIASLNSGTKNPIYGVRIVGLKSRTVLENSSSAMGIDFDVHMKISDSIVSGNFLTSKEIQYPSVEIAKDFLKKHKDLYVASEMVDPSIQLPFYSDTLGDRFIPWNPAVNQIGWAMNIMGKFALKNNWSVGIKNAKNLGISIEDSEKMNKPAPIEKVWQGLASYTTLPEEKVILIQRGVDEPDRGDYRNYPIHEVARRIKEKFNYQIFFDPSHTFGPKMKNQIVEGTVEAMKMKTSNGKYVYDGILIEVGNSKTDTYQHITISELSDLIDKASSFRTF